MINIKPSAAIRRDYNSISELCKRSGEPVYLTKNGEGDLVVMDIEAFARREDEGRNPGGIGWTARVGDTMWSGDSRCAAYYVTSSAKCQFLR